MVFVKETSTPPDEIPEISEFTSESLEGRISLPTVTEFPPISFGQTLYKGWELQQDLILFVTASHLPPEWNGIKFYYGDGVGLPEEELMKIRDLALNQDFDVVGVKDKGNIQIVDAKENYQNFFTSRFTCFFSAFGTMVRNL